MSDNVGVAIVELRADISDLKKGMNEAIKSVRGFGVGTVAMGDLISSGIKSAGRTLLDFGIKAVEAYGKSEQAALRLSNAVGGKAAAALRQYAEERQKATTFDNDAIVGLEAQLANYGILPGSIKKATEAAIQYAAATGKELPEAGVVLGQALAGQGRELKKYGLILSEGATRSENLAKTTDFLTERFKGSAEALKNTTLGQFENFKNRLADLEKQIGKELVPVIQTWAGWLEKALGFVERLTGAETANMSVNEITLAQLKKRRDQLMELAKIRAQNEGGTLRLTKAEADELTGVTKLIKATENRMKAEDKTTDNLKDNALERVGVVGDEVNAETRLYQKLARAEVSIRAETEANVRKTEKTTTALFYNEYHARMKAARESFDAQADYSHALKVRLAEDTRSWGTIMAETTMDVVHQFSSGVADMILEGRKFRDVMHSIGQSILRAFIEQIAQMVARWLIACATMRAASFSVPPPGAGSTLFPGGLGAPAAPGGGGGLAAGIAGTVTAVALTKAAIDKSISMGLSKTGSYIGGVLQGPLGAFQGGAIGKVVNSVKKTAKKLFSGGVMNEPTLLMGTRSGAVGLAGEDGPEALMSFRDMGLTPESGRNRLMGGSSGGGGGGDIHVHINGTFLEGDESKWQKIVKNVIVPEVRRWSDSRNKGPFIKTRGARA